MTTRMIYGSSAGVAAVAAAVLAFIFFGSDSGGDVQAVHAQAPPPTRPAAEKRAAESAGPAAASAISPSVEDLQRATTQPAQVEAYERTDIYAKASGFLKSVLVDIGDRVQKDQVLAELWIPEMEQELRQKIARVEQARAAVEQSRARVATAEALVAAVQAELTETKASITTAEADADFRRSEHGRIAELVRTRSVNEAIEDEKLMLLRSAESSLASAQARVQSVEAQVAVERSRKAEAIANLNYAQSQLKLAEAEQAQTAVLMQYAQIRAPYDGLVSRRWIDSGDFVTSAAATKTEPLFTIDRVEPLRITFDVPESESSLLAVGQPVALTVDALKGRTFVGRVQRTTGILDPRTRTLRVEAELDEPQPGLRPGMYGMVTVMLVDVHQALVVPTPCIRHEGRSTVVYCVNDGVAEQRVVEIGYSDGTRTQITHGLGPHDLVLVEQADATQTVGGQLSKR